MAKLKRRPNETDEELALRQQQEDEIVAGEQSVIDRGAKLKSRDDIFKPEPSPFEQGQSPAVAKPAPTPFSGLTPEQQDERIKETGKTGATLESEEQKLNITGPEIIRDGETGEVTGIRLPDGRELLGIPKADIDALAAQDVAKKQLPFGAAEGGTAQALAEDRARKIGIAKLVGQIDFATASEIENEGLNIRELLAAGSQQAVKEAIALGTTGLAAGLVTAGPTAGISVPVGVAAGGGIGIIKGFYNGVTQNIEDQRKDLVTTKTKELKQRKQAITNYISAANANPAAAEDYVIAMNIELSLIRRDYSTLIGESEENLEFWGGDATPQIVEYEVFFESVEASYKLRMEQAVLKPDPSRAYIPTSEVEE